MNKKIWEQPNMLALGLQDTKFDLRAITLSCDKCGWKDTSESNSGSFDHDCPKKS